jgi:hypothetical protein
MKGTKNANETVPIIKKIMKNDNSRITVMDHQLGENH